MLSLFLPGNQGVGSGLHLMERHRSNAPLWLSDLVEETKDQQKNRHQRASRADVGRQQRASELLDPTPKQLGPRGCRDLRLDRRRTFPGTLRRGQLRAHG